MQRAKARASLAKTDALTPLMRQYWSLLIGLPFGPTAIRAIGILDGQPLVATFDLQANEWCADEGAGQFTTMVLGHMKAAFPELFWRI